MPVHRLSHARRGMLMVFAISAMLSFFAGISNSIEVFDPLFSGIAAATGLGLIVAPCVWYFCQRYQYKHWFRLWAGPTYEVDTTDKCMSIDTHDGAVSFFVRIKARGKTELKECDLRFVEPVQSGRIFRNLIDYPEAPSRKISVTNIEHWREWQNIYNIKQDKRLTKPGKGNMTVFFIDWPNVAKNDHLFLRVVAVVRESWWGKIRFEGHNPEPRGDKVYASAELRINLKPSSQPSTPPTEGAMR